MPIRLDSEILAGTWALPLIILSLWGETFCMFRASLISMPQLCPGEEVLYGKEWMFGQYQ